MEQQAVKKNNILKRNVSLIVAFLVPILILLVIFISREIYPFGDEMYLRSDMYHQYAPFLKLFQSILKNGGSLSYTWDIGLGSNFLSTYAYYLASPLNWLVAILPSDHIPEIMSGFIMLKSGLMSAAFAYYLNHKFHRSSLLSAAFGIFYAMSGYMAAYSWNVMWLDCLVLLPLIMLGLERLVKEGRVLLYTICFALAVISNYYIAIMIAIWTFLYFLYLLIAETGAGSVRTILKKTGRYFLYSVLGGCMGAFVFLPAFLTLLGTASADSAFPSQLRAYYNVLEMFAHGMMNTEVTMMDGYVPNVYCGVLAFALVPLFLLNSAVPIRQRVGKAVLMGILIFSFAFNVPAFIWHGFHFPNSLPSRQSFLYIFLVLLIGYEVMMKIRRNSARGILICTGAAVAAFFGLQLLFDGETYPIEAAYVSAGFLIMYGIVLLFLRNRGKTYRIAAIIFLLVICTAECFVNTEETGYGTTSRVNYVEDNDTISYLLGKIDDGDFYRVEKTKRRTKNDGAWSGYRSASVFSSVTTAALSDFYESFGMQSGTNSFSWYGHTPLSSAILGVRYQLSPEPLKDPYLLLKEREEGLYLYESRYCLPPGFMVSAAAQAEVALTGQDPFSVQNGFVRAAKDLNPVFRVGKKLEGSDIRYTAEENGRLFFYVGEKVKTLTVAKMSGTSFGENQVFSSMESPMIVDVGEIFKGDQLSLTVSNEDLSSFSVIPAYLDHEALEQAVLALSTEPFVVRDFGDTYMSGTVTAEKDGMLFLTIPYDKGWSVLVDGEKGELKDFYGAFLQVPLDAGTHTIELRYRVPGMLPGLIISLTALAVFIVLQILRRKKA